jgi:hypothetical protein
MKNLSKVMVFCLLTLFSVQSFAQKIGIQGGINLANMLVKDDETTYSDEFKMNLGFNGGVTFEVGFGKLLGLEAGLIAESKGFKWEFDILDTKVSTKANLLYLDVPVLLKVGPSFGSAKVFVAAGPYVGFGLTGKLVAEAEGESDKQDVEWGDTDESDFKRLDYGAKFGAGAEVMGFTIGAYYALGLANLSPVTEGGAKINNKVLSICVGYKIGK